MQSNNIRNGWRGILKVLVASGWNRWLIEGESKAPPGLRVATKSAGCGGNVSNAGVFVSVVSFLSRWRRVSQMRGGIKCKRVI